MGSVQDDLAIKYSKTADESIDDAEFRWLGEQGGTALSLPDRWKELLVAAGYTGSLSDMYTAWVADGGTFPPV